MKVCTATNPLQEGTVKFMTKTIIVSQQ